MYARRIRYPCNNGIVVLPITMQRDYDVTMMYEMINVVIMMS